MRVIPPMYSVIVLLLVTPLHAEDRTVTGKLVDVDVEHRSVTVQLDRYQRLEFAIGAKSQVLDASGTSKEGFHDKRLKPGATVKVVLPVKSSLIKSLHFIVAPVATEKVPPRKTESGWKVASSVKWPADFDPGHGELFTVISVDKEKRIIKAKSDDSLKEQTLTLDKRTPFVGPYEGTCEEGFDDERLIAGKMIQVQWNGPGKIAKIHLPFRKK